MTVHGNCERDALLEAARQLLRDNRFGEAKDLLRDQLAAQPTDTVLHLLLARTLTLLGDEFGAEQAYADALSYDAALPQAYERWGKLCLERFALEDARSVFSRWIEQFPGDETAQYWLAASGGAPAPNRASARFVEQLYDNFAPDFDMVMDRVGYTGPMLIGSILERELGTPQGALTVLDAGCGTGLCAQELAPYAERLVGLDLSASMLAQAADRGRYTALVQGDFAAPAPNPSYEFDVVACAEALIYFGDLNAPVKALSDWLKPGGLLVLTTEQLRDADDPHGLASEYSPFCLQATGRFAHHDEHLEAAMRQAGLETIQINTAMVRTEGGEPVYAWLAAGKRSQA